MWPLIEYESLHFDNELDVYMRSKNYEANDYGRDLDLLVIACIDCVLYILWEVGAKRKVIKWHMPTLKASSMSMELYIIVYGSNVRGC